MKKSFSLLSLFFSSLAIQWAQIQPFDLLLEPLTIPSLPGLQSFAWGQWNGKWLLVGGRTDGLHRRQPPVSFDPAFNNDRFIVVDPVAGQFWQWTISGVPQDVADQLRSTNMQFEQKGEYLYLVGGYGFNTAGGNKKTFDKLIAIHLPTAINAVISGQSAASAIRFIADSRFAVTGGHLKKIGNTFYLLGGHKFDGNYNPNNGPSFTQQYTNAVRRFTLVDDGSTLQVQFLPEWVDAAAFHRRDYNAVAQIMPDGREAITVFSGVFQPAANLPFLDYVDVDSSGYTLYPSFQQRYNHYHCAVMPVYNAMDNAMHTVFFGGMAQFYDSAGTLVQDDNVPFVKTIARLTRSANGTMSEHKMIVEMPGFMGAGAEFIPREGVPTYGNDVLKLNAFTEDTTLVGYIYGGIVSTAPNIFFTNDGTQSWASNNIIKVWLVRPKTLSAEMASSSVTPLSMDIFPNPVQGKMNVTVNIPVAGPATLSLRDVKGNLIYQTQRNMAAGMNHIALNLHETVTGGIYFIHLECRAGEISRKFILR